MNKIIGIIMTDDSKQGLTHDFFSSILEGFRMKCNENNYNIAFLNSNMQQEGRGTYLEQAREIGCCGVLIACTEYSEEIKELLESDILIAAIDKDYENVVNVQSDNVKGMNAMVEYLVSMGHRRMAIITGDDNLVCSIRLNEFIKVCEKHGITIPKEYILRGYFRDTYKAAYYTEQLLRMKNPPSCILYSDDYAAIGGMNVIHARGLEIPDDISITGYDGNDILSKLEPSLTTVYQDTLGMGKLAAEKLIYHIENPQDKNFQEYLLDTVLQVGRTVGRVYDDL